MYVNLNWSRFNVTRITISGTTYPVGNNGFIANGFTYVLTPTSSPTGYLKVQITTGIGAMVTAFDHIYVDSSASAGSPYAVIV